MASAAEVYVSRVGGTAGVSGAFGMTTTHHVTTDSVGDDPKTVLATRSNTGSVHIGKLFPWGGFGIVAFDYAVVDRLSPLVWELDVLYRPPLFINTPGHGLWNWEWNTGLQSERAFFDLEGEPIGPNRYSILEGPPSGFDFHADTVSGQVPLQRTSSVSLIGVDHVRRLATLSLDRVFALMPPENVANANNRVGEINAAPFWGAGEGTLRFGGATLRRRTAGYLPGSFASTAFEVFLAFDHDPRGHSPVKVAHTWRDADGETTIRDNGTFTPVTTGYVLDEETDFNALLAEFD